MKLGFTINSVALIHMLTDNKFSNITAYQICVSNLNQFDKAIEFTTDEQHNINLLRKQKDVYIVVHGKYIYNFCRTDYKKFAKYLISEMRVANSIGCDVIIHQGSNVEKLPLMRAIENYVSGIKYILNETKDIKNKLILENSAKEGNDIGYDIETLSVIYGKFTQEEKERIGFCIDTCHIFVSGELNLLNISDIRKFFDKFDQLIGIEKLNVIHLNDSKTAFGKCSDRHADIGFGYITDNGKCFDGLSEIKKYADLYNIPMILETPCDKSLPKDQIDIIYGLDLIF